MKFFPISTHRRHRNSRSAFTIVELMVASGLFAMIGGIAYFILNAGTVLYAKNFSINASGGALRAGLDRINAEVSQATAVPQLVILGSGGAFTTSTSTGTAAAGIIFDKFLGGPYILESTGTATATSFSMKHSTNAAVIAPIPSTDDIIVIDGSPSTNRSRVSSASGGSISSARQSIAVTLRSGSVTGVSWISSDNKPATLARRVAFIVVGNELRFYSNMEGATTYNTSATPYTVLTTDIGTSTGEGTPFSLVTKNTQTFLSMSFRVQTRDTNQVLANKETKEINSSMRIDTLLRPRNAL